jgi:hypothetical protein
VAADMAEEHQQFKIASVLRGQHVTEY